MFISYAQNFEDVILWRALKHVRKGFYIDVGAQDPVIDSVSLGFYENGWRGIHAEATTYYAEKIRLARPDESVAQCAIGTGEGNILFYEIGDSGLSTSDHEIAMRHQSAGRTIVETQVPLMPLSKLFQQAEERDIHWLKIDVEGMEASVINSWAPSPARPWIVVVESTLPNSQEPSYSAWEPELLQKGYKFAYFDGLSRYYVSDDRPELFHFFGPGPNVFDEFSLAETTPYTTELRSKITANEHELQKRTHKIQLLNEQLYRSENSARLLENTVAEALNREVQLRQELAHTYESLSWQLTAPLRFANAVARSVVADALSWVKLRPGTLPRKISGRIIGALARSVIRHPRLVRLAKRLLTHFPTLEPRLRRIASGDHAVISNTFILGADAATAMTEPTSLVLDRLQRAYDEKRAERA